MALALAWKILNERSKSFEHAARNPRSLLYVTVSQREGLSDHLARSNFYYLRHKKTDNDFLIMKIVDVFKIFQTIPENFKALLLSPTSAF